MHSTLPEAPGSVQAHEGAAALENSPDWDTLAPERRLDLAWKLFSALEFQVQIADRKVQAIFGANTLLVAALSLYGHSSYAELVRGGFTGWEIAGIAGKVLLLGCACSSVVFAILSLTPRVKFAPRSLPGPLRSPFFFGDIAGMTEREFLTSFGALSAEEATNEMLIQVRQVALVVAAKHLWSRRSATSLVISLGLWMALLVVRFFS